MITLQDLSDTSVSVATAPALVAAVPTTNWLFPVAAAPEPKITEPEKFPLLVLIPNAVLFAPVVLADKAFTPTAVLKLPVVLEVNAEVPTATLFEAVLSFKAW